MSDFRVIPVKNAGCAKVSAEDFDRVSQRRWYAAQRGRAVAKTIYAESAKYPQIMMHRLVLGELAAGMVIDHINGDGLDNRRCNLRVCTQRENARNRRSVNGFRGVSWRPDYGKWRARIMVDRREISLGTYDIAEHAAEAYNRAAIEHYGQFAKLNVFGPAPSEEAANAA